jgi:uncharacterized protein HemX
MKEKKTPLLFLLAVVGVCALAYGVWIIYARQAAREQARAMFAAPASSGLPDVIHASPGPPPPQP